MTAQEEVYNSFVSEIAAEFRKVGKVNMRITKLLIAVDMLEEIWPELKKETQ